MKAGNPEKYKGLIISKEAQALLDNDPKKFASYCNGVGSRVGFWNKLLWHFIPNTILFMNVTDCSDLHDVEYSVPDVFESIAAARSHFMAANQRFLINLEIRIKERNSWEWLEDARLDRAAKYFKIVSSEKGWESFIAGKTIKEEKTAKK